jgi:hypothetical protein
MRQAIRLDPGQFLAHYLNGCACAQALLGGNAFGLEELFPAGRAGNGANVFLGEFSLRDKVGSRNST